MQHKIVNMETGGTGASGVTVQVYVVRYASICQHMWSVYVVRVGYRDIESVTVQLQSMEARIALEAIGLQKALRSGHK